MTERTAASADVDATCAILRDVLLRTRDLDRRGFLAALGRAAAGATLLAPFGALARRAQAAEAPITAFTFGGVWKKSMIAAFGDPFTQKTGIPVQYQDPYTWPKLRAMHDTGAQQIDVVSVQGTEVILAERLQMVTPIDWSVVDRSALDPQQLRNPNAIGAHTLSFVICYSKKKWPGEHHPNTWADFWDVEKFPGRRVLRRDENWTLEAALKADGVKDNDFYPIDVDRAFRSLDRIKPHVKAWYTDNSLAQQLMAQEEVDLIAVVNGRASESIINHHAPFEMVWNEAICSGTGQGWLVPIGCPNPKGGMKFLDIVGRAECQAVFSRLLYYGPQNPKAYDLLPPDIARLLPTYPDNVKLAHMVNYDWWADNLAPVQRRFERWLQS
jgi:putative spermidine/putrescine transport system substrate-binding protein